MSLIIIIEQILNTYRIFDSPNCTLKISYCTVYEIKSEGIFMGVSIHWTGLLDWITGLDYWTGLLDWITGLDYWTGLLDLHKICSNKFFRPQTPFTITKVIT